MSGCCRGGRPLLSLVGSPSRCCRRRHRRRRSCRVEETLALCCWPPEARLSVDPPLSADAVSRSLSISAHSAGRSGSGTRRTTVSPLARRRRRRRMPRSRPRSPTPSPRRLLRAPISACWTPTSTLSSTRVGFLRASRRGRASAAGATVSFLRARSSSSTSSAWRGRRSKRAHVQSRVACFLLSTPGLGAASSPRGTCLCSPSFVCARGASAP